MRGALMLDPMSDVEARNKETVRAHFAALATGDADAFAATHHP